MYGKWLARSLIVGVLAFGVMTFAPNANIQQSGVTVSTEAQARDRRRSERRRGGGGVGFGITIDLGKIFSGSKKKKRKAKKPRRRKPEKRKARRKPEKKREKRKAERIPELPIVKFTAVAGWRKEYEGKCNPMDPFIIVKDGPDGQYCIWKEDNEECAEKNSSKKNGKCTCNPGFDEKTYPNCKPHGWKDPVREAKKPSPARQKLKPVPSIGLPGVGLAVGGPCDPPIPHASINKEGKCGCDPRLQPIYLRGILRHCLEMYAGPITVGEKTKKTECSYGGTVTPADDVPWGFKPHRCRQKYRPECIKHPTWRHIRDEWETPFATEWTIPIRRKCKKKDKIRVKLCVYMGLSKPRSEGGEPIWYSLTQKRPPKVPPEFQKLQQQHIQELRQQRAAEMQKAREELIKKKKLRHKMIQKRPQEIPSGEFEGQDIEKPIARTEGEEPPMSSQFRPNYRSAAITLDPPQMESDPKSELVPIKMYMPAPMGGLIHYFWKEIDGDDNDWPCPPIGEKAVGEWYVP